MKRIAIASLLLVATLCWGTRALGQIIVVNDGNGDGVSDGPRTLLPDTPGQLVNIYVTGGAPVDGLNFNVQIGDGYPDAAGSSVDGPDITNVDVLGTAASPNVFFGSNPPQLIRVADQIWSVSVTTESESVPASGLLATLTISTVGFSSGSWALSLADTDEGSTDFADISAQITDGTISVVPEPRSQLAIGAFLLTAGWLWRRFRS